MRNLYKLKGRPEETGQTAPALVAAGCRFTGEIRAEADVVVEGELSGKIQVGGRLIVRAAGMVRSEDAECRIAEIFGLFEGTLEVTEHLTIHEKGRVRGNIKVEKISIDTGGHFDGNCVSFSEECPLTNSCLPIASEEKDVSETEQ